MITEKMTRDMAQEFNTRALQEIGIAAERFLNTINDLNREPWKLTESQRDAIHGFRMLADGAKLVIRAQG